MKRVLTIGLALLALTPAVASADGRGRRFDPRSDYTRQQDEAYRERREGRTLGLGEISSIARRAVGGGEMLDSQRMERGGRTVYRVILRTERGRADVIVDAQTGQVLDVR